MMAGNDTSAEVDTRGTPLTLLWKSWRRSEGKAMQSIASFSSETANWLPR